MTTVSDFYAPEPTLEMDISQDLDRTNGIKHTAQAYRMSMEISSFANMQASSQEYSVSESTRPRAQISSVDSNFKIVNSQKYNYRHSNSQQRRPLSTTAIPSHISISEHANTKSAPGSPLVNMHKMKEQESRSSLEVLRSKPKRVSMIESVKSNTLPPIASKKSDNEPIPMALSDLDPQLAQDAPNQSLPTSQANTSMPIMNSSSSNLPNSSRPATPLGAEAHRRRTITRKLSENFGARKIDEKHDKLSVSRCETKDDRVLLPNDFKAQHKLTSDITGAELESKQKYDFKFKDYCPMVFRRIRAAFGLAASDYLNSLTGKYILSELYSPGKSKSYLYYSHDYRYIIKTIHHAEQQRLLKILPEYVEHCSKNPNTLLARYYGLHRMKMPDHQPVHFVVMSNVFPPNYDIHLTFDLKGSTVGREVLPEEVQKKGKRAVLKDINWINMEQHLYLGPEKSKIFSEQLEKDTVFLMTKKIMDYSLLVGIHDLTRGNGGSDEQYGIQLFEPNRMTLKRAPSTPKADAMRRALQQPEIIRIDTISALQLPPDDTSTKLRSIFFADNGGFLGTDINNRPTTELYFISIIDILTPYNAQKRLEHLFKSITMNSHEISAVKPSEYGRRFIRFMKSLVSSIDTNMRIKETIDEE